MEQTIQDYLAFLRDGRKPRSERTLAEYAWQLRRLAAWGVKQSPPITSAADFKLRHLQLYLKERRHLDGVGPSAIGVATSALRGFFRWGLGKRRSPAEGLEHPLVEMEEQRTLTPDQAMRVLEVPDTSSVIGKRDLAILCLMLDTGLRASEVANLRLDKVRLDEGYLSVRGKRSKLLYKAFCPYTTTQLAAWLSVRQAAPECDRFFVSVRHGRGRRHPLGKPLTRQALRCVCVRVARPAGLAALSPHDLRRTCLCFALLLGCPEVVAKSQLGWSKEPSDMVARYSLAVQVKAFLTYSPVRWLMSGQVAPASAAELHT